MEYFENCDDKIDAIIHLAAKTSINDSLNDPCETYYINIVGTLNVLEFAKRKNITNFIQEMNPPFCFDSYSCIKAHCLSASSTKLV